ncbi:MAG: FAD-dependent monooxygenase [Betaproteobacteria bacterium]|nr:FAD-dependent monooxygenase [Betaproteobacteria bacterium]
MNVDVAVVGGGPVGGSFARALAPTGLSVALVEPRVARALPSSGFDQRVYALNRHSRRFLERCEIWQQLSLERVAPVREMRVFGDDASKIEFSAYRSGVPELASIVEEANLQQALQSALATQANLTLLTGIECTGARWNDALATLSLSDGRQIEARLVVAADGAESALRTAAGIATQVHHYAQTGVVANFRAGRTHRDVAYQWFLTHGVLALLPLPGNHISMVWSAPDAHAQVLLDAGAEELARMVEQASSGTLGQLQPVSAAVGFPLQRMRAKRLIGPRLALVGDTAHNVHPLAGQGLNLGFGDAQALAAVLAERGMESDSGAVSLLRRFERSRREDLLAMEVVTDGLQVLFDSSLPGAKRLRNAGLRLTNRFSPLKRLLVKRALG